MVREAREAAGLTPEDLAATTRIRAALITDIEADDFRRCGGDAYARGHIRALSTAIGLDPAVAAAAFDTQVGASRVTPMVLPIESDMSRMPGERRSFGFNWTMAMALALVGVLGFTLFSFLTNRGGPGATLADPVIASTSAPASPAPSRAVSSTPSLPSSTPVGPVAQVPGGGVEVTLLVTGDVSWISVTNSAGKTLFENVLRKGDRKTFTDTDLVRLVLGNAGAVDLTVNGRSLGTPGGLGKVVKVSFGPGDPGASGA